MGELSIMNIMKTIVPITRYNQNEASKIFDEVEASGIKIVIKNNSPACVLMSPEQYESLMEMLSDYILQEEAEKRMASHNPDECLSQEELMQELGISQADLDAVDVEIE